MSDRRSSRINITKRGDRSLPSALLQCLIHPFGSLISKPGKSLPAGSPQLKPHSSLSGQCNVTERQIEDTWIYDITANVPHDDTKDGTDNRLPSWRIYYIAGGSFCMLPSSEHWKFCAELSRMIPHSVISLISPPLAPHSPAPVTFPHLLRLYKTLMTSSKEGESISFVGDSSGGNIVLSLVMNAVREFPGVRSPTNIMIIAPVVDLRFTNPKIKQVEGKDPVLRRHIEIATAESWAGSWDLSDPRLSPLLADPSMLRDNSVKVHGVVGGYDLLTPDTVLFREKCQAAGVEGDWLEWEKQMHCFPLAFTYRLPESVQGKDWVVDVLKRKS
ncbi:hypothetical protein MMC28_007236 [Mycoblastus sanguinarius]|nr:hypothetical protein [Mycoblastus sanguinarius]